MMKRIYVFLIVALSLLTIPQTALADLVMYMHGNFDNGAWEGTKKAFTSQGNSTYTLDYTSDKTGEFRCRFYGVANNSKWDNEICPYTDKTDLLTSSPYTITENCYNTSPRGDYYFIVNMEAGKTYTFTFKDETKRSISCEVKGDNGGGSSTNTNPLNGRTLTEGYYLVGNFFAYDGSTINYDAPVFKFQQKTDDATGKSQYQVEIPATLTAHAQIMSVDAYGKVNAIYGPSSIYAINNTVPANNSSVSGNLMANAETEIKAEYSNYWDMSTRSTINDASVKTPGQDGSYQVVLTLGDDGKPSIWSIAHNDLKRVAFLIAADSYGTALAISNIRHNSEDAFNQGKYYGGLYMQSGKQYYFISNEVACNERVTNGHIYSGYQVNKNGIDKPTYNKLFLWGCGGKDYVANNHYIAADDGTFMSDIEGYYVLEFNFNNGNNTISAQHGGMTGQVQQHSGKETISSVSMVGSAIPGTVDGTEWNWESTAADMTWDANENCYKLSLVTTAEEGEEYFRFVANHKFELNWHEESTEENDKARKKYQETGLTGHAATAADPNVVCYSDSETRHDADDFHIIWNRPAGNWTVRFYTNTAIENGQPVYTYYYTITENHTLELRDLEDVTYKGATRNVLLRGNYKYFRTWSGKKVWKCNKNVDVFIVKSSGTSDDPKFKLVKVSQESSDYTVIPASVGVILAVKGTDVDGDKVDLSEVGQVISAPSATSYNLLRIPMEEYENYTRSSEFEGNLLKTCVTAQTIPTYTRDEAKGNVFFNYLFGFFRASKGDPEHKVQATYKDNDFLMGFWISNGNGTFYSNSAYLPVDEATAKKLNLGTSYSDYDATSGAKKMPAVLFDFSDVENSTTGISNHQNGISNSNECYYTLGGQRICKPNASGIYIHNGKKYIVK